MHRIPGHAQGLPAAARLEVESGVAPEFKNSSLIGAPTGLKRPRVTALQQAAVERAEAYARAHMDPPVTIAALSSVLGMSERSLRNAFHTVRGMSPKRCLLADRLQAARRALGDAGENPVTVTGVATDYGFYELGRFSRAYRKAFGETPSDTLRGVGRAPQR
jgi:transcriptional regulator GlxA family with amidase domain